MLFFGCLFASPQLFAGTETDALTWYGIIPALLAIFLAICTKQVILSLITGIISGSIIQSFLNDSNTHFFWLDKVFDHYLLNSIADKGHASIILFSLVISRLLVASSKINMLGLWYSALAIPILCL